MNYGPGRALNSEQIQPSTNLTWVPCYTSGFECARLAVRYLATFLLSQNAYVSSQVPLDYTTNATDAMAAVALVRLPSPLSKDEKDYRGPVLFNPGMLLSMLFVVLLILSV
jgi:hypothetical protein